MKTLGEYIAESNISGVMKAYNGKSWFIDTPAWYRRAYCTKGEIVRTKALIFDFANNNSIVLHWYNENNRPNGFYRLANITINGKLTEFKYDDMTKIKRKTGTGSHLLHDEGNRDVATDLADFLKYCKNAAEKNSFSIEGVFNKFAECIRRNNISFDLDD